MGCSDSKSTNSVDNKPKTENPQNNQGQSNANHQQQNIKGSGEQEKVVELKFDGTCVLYAEVIPNDDADLGELDRLCDEVAKFTREETGCLIYACGKIMHEKEPTRVAKYVFVGKFKTAEAAKAHQDNENNKPLIEAFTKLCVPGSLKGSMHMIVDNNENVRPWVQRDLNKENPELYILIQLKPKPEFKNKVLMGGPQIVGPTRLEEGCLNFDFMSVKGSDSISFFAVFTDKSAFDLHHETEHIKKAMPQMMEMLAESEFNISARIC